MSVVPNPVDGAVVDKDGSLTPMPGPDASAANTQPPNDMAPAVPIAMTEGRQISAARPV